MTFDPTTSEKIIALAFQSGITQAQEYGSCPTDEEVLDFASKIIELYNEKGNSNVKNDNT